MKAVIVIAEASEKSFATYSKPKPELVCDWTRELNTPRRYA